MNAPLHDDFAALPLRLFVNAVAAARRGDTQGVASLCAWFNARRAASSLPAPLELAGSVHVWVRDARDPSRIWIAHGADEVGFDNIRLVTQPSWRDAVATVGRHTYAVFIREQTSVEADDAGFVEIQLVNGVSYEGYDVARWDDRVVATRELAAFALRFPRVWAQILAKVDAQADAERAP